MPTPSVPTSSTLKRKTKGAIRRVRAAGRGALGGLRGGSVSPADSAHPVGAPAVDAPAGDGNILGDVFHNSLHELRSVELEGVTKGAREALSIGASGGWYFDWFEAHYGPLDSHIGVEAYEPEPGDLPSYVSWIDSTADRFVGVEDDSIDLVFSGQVTEHLWAEQLVGFLCESKRVLRPGGLLVADSPNRLVTEHLNWSHGGHTVELSPDEWVELLGLAGFTATRVRGIWRCWIDDRYSELEEGLNNPAVLARKIAAAGNSPDQSFVWWIDAESSDTPVQVEELTARVKELYETHWSTRVCRGMWPGPGSTGPEFHPGDQVRVTGLPFMLRKGKWSVTVEASHGGLDSLKGLAVRIYTPGEHLLREGDLVSSDGSTAVFQIDLDTTHLACSLDLSADECTSSVGLKMPMEIAAVDS